MRRFVLLTLALGLFLPLLAAAPANAQATRTWVSGTGDDANPCSRTAPCKTFAGAISKTAGGGEINCIDPGGFGALTVTKSMTLNCENTLSGVLVSSTNGIIFNAQPTDYLIVKGLDIEGLGAQASLSGIDFIGGGFLRVENCNIRNFKAGTPNGFGIKIAPSTTAKFTIINTQIFSAGQGTTGAGIQIKPTGGATTGVIDHVLVDGSVFGVAADGSGGTAGINVTVSNSVINANTSGGILATTGAVGVGVMVTNSVITNNGTGLQSAGAGANLRIGGSTVTGNSNATSGTVLSYVNNQVNGNANDGTFTPIAPAFH
jgi:hypothetical protein